MSFSSNMSTNRSRLDRGFVNMEDLPKGPNGRILCRYCATEVSPPRRTFCDDRCVDSFRIESSPSFAREKVFERDRGVCQGCGLDTEKLKSVLFELRLRAPTEYDRLTRRYQATFGFGFRVEDHFWEMDHTKAVVLGGGSCGLDNLKTLCRPCHGRKTRHDLYKLRALHTVGTIED